MPGRIVSVRSRWQCRHGGQKLVVLEAMKMEQALAAPFDGIVRELRATLGSRWSKARYWCGWKKTPDGRPLVGDTTLGTLVADLGYNKLVHLSPVFLGDKVRVESEVAEVRASRSRPDTGIITFAHRLLNERNEIVCGACARR